MTVTILVAGIIAPAMLWTGYFYYKDRFQPEPLFYIGITYILGIAAAFVCYKSYGLLPLLGLPEDASLIMDNNRPFFLVYCLGVVGILEELLKFLPFLLIVLRFKSFDEKIDGIIYASVIALGFASFENFHYLSFMDGFALVGRAVASPLTHTVFASIWGYAVGKAHLAGRPLWKASLIGLFISALCHGLYDFLTTSPTLRISSAVIILAAWVWQIWKMEKLHKAASAVS